MKTILKPIFYLFIGVWFILRLVYESVILGWKRIKYRNRKQEYQWAKIKFKHNVGSVGIYFK